MKKGILIILLTLLAFGLIAAEPVDIIITGDEVLNDGFGSIVKKPGMCYDPVFNVYYLCVGKGLEKKYPWLTEKQLQNKVNQMWEDIFLSSDSLICKRIWEPDSSGYFSYVCFWNEDLIFGHKFNLNY